jgi:hypothetical protein
VPERSAAVHQPESEDSAVALVPQAALAGTEAGALLALQRTAGNRAVAALVARREARAAVARDSDTWSKDYKTRKSRQALSYDDYKAKIGTAGAESYAPEIKAASAWGGTKVTPVALTRAELGAIVLPEVKDAAGLAAHEQRLDDYLPFINNAFEAMKIDTVEAQSSFLAHAAESGSFAALTEIGASTRPYAPFIGRGPIQVTWEAGYVQSIAYIEARGEQLAAEAATLEQATPGSPEAKRLRELAALCAEAKTAIKGDIAEAANPKYTFLFSTALMHITRGVKRSANLKGVASPAFAGNSNEDQWVTNFQESFQDTLDKAPARKAAAEVRLKAAEAALAATPSDDAAALKAAQGKVKAEKSAVAMQDGAIRDMPSALRGAKVKKAIYERAYKVLSAKAAGAPAAAPTAAPPTPVPPAAAPTGDAGPSSVEEDPYTKAHPWSSPAFF